MLQTRSFIGFEGQVLQADECGPADGPHVVLLHGGGQTRYAWSHATTRFAAAGYRTTAVDLRGHGESDWASDGNYTMDAHAHDISAVIDAIGQPVVLVGASVGGLAALLAVGFRNQADVQALVLVDVVTRPNLDGAQRVIDFMSQHRNGFDTLDDAAGAVSAYLPHRTRPVDPAGLKKNLKRTQDGRWMWRWDPRLAAGDRHIKPHGDADRLEQIATRLTIPMLLVRGTQSDIVTPEAADAFLQFVPAAEVIDVSDAGHMVAGDNNEIFTSAVLDFMERLRG
jgi:pimeloyl-ACP methyl ester carboxylesterase